MGENIHHWQYKCVEEDALVYMWSKDAPTTCPNNNTHTIDSNTPVTIIDTITTNKVQVEEDSHGYFETTHLLFDIPTGTPGNVTEHDVSWPMNILLWKTYLTPSSDMIGDTISVLASPETTVGVLTAPANIGDTILNVNSTVLENMYRGFLVTIDDGINKDVLGRCTNIDITNSQISVQTPLSYAFAAMVPVKISVYIIKDIHIGSAEKISIAAKGFKGKNIPAGMIVRVYYTNNSGTVKTFRFRTEIYNNG